MNIFSFTLLLIINIVSLVASDIPPWSQDTVFQLWCGALSAKEIKCEQVTDISSRQFLGINEITINMNLHYIPRDSQITDDVVADEENVLLNSTTGERDRRLGNRWRLLDNKTNVRLPINDTIDFDVYLNPYGRYHSVRFADRSCSRRNNDSDEKALQLYPNSIPYGTSFYLYGGICAHKDGNVWVNANLLPMALDENKTDFPVHILWVEKFKEPLIMHTCMLQARTYEIVKKTVAIKVVEDTFQIYYDASAETEEDVEIAKSISPGSHTITVTSPIVRCDPPSLWVVSYTLGRMKQQFSRIDKNKLSHWHKIYTDMKQNNTFNNEIRDKTRAEMCQILDQLENT